MSGLGKALTLLWWFVLALHVLSSSLHSVCRLGFEDLPFSRRLKKIKEFLELSSVPKEDVLFELGEYLS